MCKGESSNAACSVVRLACVSCAVVALPKNERRIGDHYLLDDDSDTDNDARVHVPPEEAETSQTLHSSTNGLSKPPNYNNVTAPTLETILLPFHSNTNVYFTVFIFRVQSIFKYSPVKSIANRSLIYTLLN